MDQTIFLALAIVILNVCVQLILKKGALMIDKSLLSFDHLFALLLQAASNVYIFISLVLLGISFILWIFLLPRIQLSVIYPVTVSLNFVLVLIATRIFFHESVSSQQMLGIIIIILGIFLLLQKAT